MQHISLCKLRSRMELKSKARCFSTLYNFSRLRGNEFEKWKQKKLREIKIFSWKCFTVSLIKMKELSETSAPYEGRRKENTGECSERNKVNKIHLEL